MMVQRRYGTTDDTMSVTTHGGKFALHRDEEGRTTKVTRQEYRNKRRAANRVAKASRKANRGKR